MYKTLYIMVFTCITVMGYGQKSTLLQNINFRAKELKHTLNLDGDSLVLQSDKTIYSVDIFNEDFEKSIRVNGKATKIDLRDTPLGRLVVQAKLVDKRILMTLLRHEAYEEPAVTYKTPVAVKTNIIAKKPVIETRTIEPSIHIKVATKHINPLSIDKTTQITSEIKLKKFAEITKTEPNLPPPSSMESILNSRLKKDVNEKYFWTIHNVNTGNVSYSTMKLVNEALAKKMIARNKFETKTPQGKLNTLIVWEVYDTTNFMKLQIANADYIKSTQSQYFNVIPYFSTSKNSVIR